MPSSPDLPLLCRQRGLGAGHRVSSEGAAVVLLLVVVAPGGGVPRGAGDGVPLPPVRTPWSRGMASAAGQLRRRLLDHGRLVRLDCRRLKEAAEDVQLWLLPGNADGRSATIAMLTVN